MKCIGNKYQFEKEPGITMESLKLRGLSVGYKTEKIPVTQKKLRVGYSRAWEAVASVVVFDMSSSNDFSSPLPPETKVDVPPPCLHFDCHQSIWNVPEGIHTLDAETMECYYQGDSVGLWVFEDLEEAYFSGRMSHSAILELLRANALRGTRRSFYEAQAKRLGLI